MWYKLVEHKNGEYTDGSGKTYTIVQCHRNLDETGSKNIELGFIMFEDLETCVENWGITRIQKTDEDLFIL